MVNMMLYQSPYQGFVAYASALFAVALVKYRFVPLFLGEILDKVHQVYIHQLKVVNK